LFKWRYKGVIIHMNEDEVKKCKDDTVYFIEKYLGVRLTPWQKLYLKAFPNEKYIRAMGRTTGKKILYDSIIAYEKLLSELEKE